MFLCSVNCKLSFCHSLPHGPISNTVWSVLIAHYYLQCTLPTMPCMAKGVKLVCLISLCIDYKLWIPWPLRLNDSDGCIVLIDSTMSDIRWWWLITWNYQFLYCTDYWWNCTALLIYSLCLINMLVWVWLL